MERDNATLLDLARAAGLALEFTRGMSKAEFLADLKTQSAVERQLIVLGEAVKRLSRELRQAHPEIPWMDIAGMRDKLSHHYDDVDLELVWDVIQNHLPSFLTQLQALLPRPE